MQRCGAEAVCSPLCQRQLVARFSSEHQHLFSLYVHANVSWPGYPPGSLFADALLPDRVVSHVGPCLPVAQLARPHASFGAALLLDVGEGLRHSLRSSRPTAPPVPPLSRRPQATAWAAYSLVEAERRLLGAALADPATAWLVLLSDTTLPLYPPTLLWRQLMSERKSRINACWAPVRCGLRAQRIGPDWLRGLGGLGSAQCWLEPRHYCGRMLAREGYRTAASPSCSSTTHFPEPLPHVPASPACRTAAPTSGAGRGACRRQPSGAATGASLRSGRCSCAGGLLHHGACLAAAHVRTGMICPAHVRCMLCALCVLHAPRSAVKHAQRITHHVCMCCRHAEMVAADTEVSNVFKQYCYVGWDERLQRCEGRGGGPCWWKPGSLPPATLWLGLDKGGAAA